MGLQTHWTCCKMDLGQDIIYLWLPITCPSVGDCNGISVSLMFVSVLPTCSRVFKVWITLCPRYRFSGKWHNHLWGRAEGLSLYLPLWCCQVLSEVFACSPGKGSQFSSSKEEGAPLASPENSGNSEGAGPSGSPLLGMGIPRISQNGKEGPILSYQDSDFGKGGVSHQCVQAPL